MSRSINGPADREPDMIVVSVKEYRRNASLHMPKASLLNHIATDIHFKGPVGCLAAPRPA